MMIIARTLPRLVGSAMKASLLWSAATSNKNPRPLPPPRLSHSPNETRILLASGSTTTVGHDRVGYDST
jgi:hypothetical protein